MRLLRIFSIIGIIIGILVILTSSTLLFLNSRNNNNTSDTEITIVEDINEEYSSPTILAKENVKEEEETEEMIKENISALEESAWIPYWGFDLGFDGLKNNLGTINTINPVIYSINSNGKLQKNNVSEENLKILINYCKENNIKVIPTIGSYNYDNLDILFSSEEIYSKNIQDILSEIEKYEYDGIDLDYELIHSSNKNSYTSYITKLQNELEKNNKILSVTVFAQWGENTIYTNHQETREVQDYSKIGEIADEVRIMVYDYTSSTSTTPGPIGPISWIEDILNYATETISKDKIFLGIHLYSYEWVGDKVSALTYTTVKSLLSNEYIQSTYKEDIGEGYAKYSCEEGNSICVLYYQTKEGVEDRREIAKEYNLKGISYWRLGGEMDILQP